MRGLTPPKSAGTFEVHTELVTVTNYEEGWLAWWFWWVWREIGKIKGRNRTSSLSGFIVTFVGNFYRYLASQVWDLGCASAVFTLVKICTSVTLHSSHPRPVFLPSTCAFCAAITVEPALGWFLGIWLACNCYKRSWASICGLGVTGYGLQVTGYGW